MENRPMQRYIIITYLTFWLMVLVICGGASMILHAPPLVMRILADVCAWSPTLVLLTIWKKLRPEQTRRDFIAECFSGELVWYLLLLLVVIISGGVIGSAYLLSLLEHRVFSSYFSMGGWSLTASLLLSLFSGPTGEELGWRGYLREELSKHYPFTRAALVQGAIWTFWHTILWFVDSDFTGWELLPYIFSNLIVMTCLTYMMNVILEKHHNLVYSILMHFAFNFPYCFLRVDIWFYVILSAMFLTLSLGFCCIRHRQANMKTH